MPRQVPFAVGVVVAACGGASGQLMVLDQFLLGSDPFAGEYPADSVLNGQGPTGGTIIGFQGLWEAPVSEDDLSGTAYVDPTGLTYQVGPERLETEGGSHRYRRNRGNGVTYWSWRGASPGETRTDWWASVLIRTTLQPHSGAVVLEFTGGGALEFGLGMHGMPFIADLHGQAAQAPTEQTHLLVAHVRDDPVEGEFVELWVDPVPLRATLGGDPPLAPQAAGVPANDVLVNGEAALDFIDFWMHTYSGYDIYHDEIRVGGSWSDVVPVVVEPGCNGADLADPLFLLDLADVNAFVAAFVGGHPVADLAAPVGLLDLADINAFVIGFLSGCP
jgi:hypothetical protein